MMIELSDLIGLGCFFVICGIPVGLLSYSSLRGTKKYFLQEELDILAEKKAQDIKIAAHLAAKELAKADLPIMGVYLGNDNQKEIT